MLVFSMSTTLIQAVPPIAGALYAHGDMEGIRRLWLRMTRYTAAVAWPLALGLGLCAGPVLRVWVGADYVQFHGVVQVLLVAFVVTAHNHVAFGILMAMLRIRPLVLRYSAPQAVLNLVLSVWLVNVMGITGVAIGTMLPAVLLQYTFTTYALSSLSLQWVDLWRDVVRPTAVPALTAFAPAFAVYAVAGPASWWLLPAASLSGVLYLTLFWRAMRGSERDELLASLPAPLRQLLPA
jgi:O-antigen/teichoic acid export membrane protein